MMYIAYSLKCIRFYHNAYRQFCFLQGTRLYDLLNTYSLYCISYIFILFSYSLPRLLLFIHFHLCYTYHYYISRKGNTMSNNKKKKKKNNHTSATSNVQAKKQTAVQTAKPAKAQNIETKQETVNTQAAVEKKEPVKVQTIENKQEPPHEFKDPRKVPPKEDLKIEDKLEFATMSRKERRAAKRKRLKETTEGMTLVQKLQYFLYAYKMEILLPLIVIIAISLIVVAFFRGNKPIALSYAVVNCEDLEALDPSVIETDYWNYYSFDDNYQFQKVLDLKYDPSTSTNEASKDTESGNYIAFPTLCDENYYDIIITNKRGLEYLSESSIIHTLGEALPSDLYDIFTADYNDQITTSPAYTGKSAPYAINISDTDFAKKLNPGYDDVYICFPGVSEDNQKRVKQICNFIFDLGLDL